MSGPRIVGLCEGYGGLTMGVQSVLGGHLVAYAEIKPAAVALLADRHPGVPNLGDLTVADWTTVEADIITAGWPCQPHSAAGKRLGEEDPRAIWPAVPDVIRTVRPPLFVGENVARITSNGELRRVVSSLAEIGYVGTWRCAPASGLVGTLHRRDRVCLVAVDADADPESLRRLERWAESARVQWGPGPTDGGGSAVVEPGAVADALGLDVRDKPGRGGGPDQAGAGVAGHDGTPRPDRLNLLPTPTANLGDSRRGSPSAEVGARRLAQGRRMLEDAVAVHLLPTPTARDHKGAGWGDQPGRPLSETVHRLLPTPTENMTTGPGVSGRDGGLNLQTAAALLPTPTVNDARNGRNATAGRSDGAEFHSGWTLSDVAHADRWGVYGPAIRRWELALGRPAPEPTRPSPRAPHGPQLSPAFVEWMMGLPDGCVTGGAPGVGHDKRGRWTAPGERNAFLSLLGDGVVPQWAAVQVRDLLPIALGAATDSAGVA